MWFSLLIFRKFLAWNLQLRYFNDRFPGQRETYLLPWVSDISAFFRKLPIANAYLLNILFSDVKKISTTDAGSAWLEIVIQLLSLLFKCLYFRKFLFDRSKNKKWQLFDLKHIYRGVLWANGVESNKLTFDIIDESIFWCL